VYRRSLGPMMEHTPPVSCFRQAREAVDKAAADVDAWWSTSRFKRTQFRRSRSRLPARPCPKWLRTGSAATGTVAVMAVALTVALLGLGAVMAAGDVIGAHTHRRSWPISDRLVLRVPDRCCSGLAGRPPHAYLGSPVNRQGSGLQPAHVFLTGEAKRVFILNKP